MPPPETRPIRRHGAVDAEVRVRSRATPRLALREHRPVTHHATTGRARSRATTLPAKPHRTSAFSGHGPEQTIPTVSRISAPVRIR